MKLRVRAAGRVAVTLLLLVGTLGCSNGGQSKPKEPEIGECVDVANAPIKRIVQQDGSSTASVEAVSGDLRVGNFAGLVRSASDLNAPIGAKLYWMPSDVGIAKTAALTVTVAERDHLDLIQSTQVFGGGGNWSRVPNGQYFWATNLLLPAAGRWRVIGAVSGLTSGCFDLDIH